MKTSFQSLQPTNQLIKQEVINTFESFFDSGQYILEQKILTFELEYANFNQVPFNTSILNVLAISYTGVKPIFVKPEIHTYNINPSLIESKITSNTDAVIPVQLHMQGCRIDANTDIATKNQLKVVEDNAQVHETSWKGKPIGGWRIISVPSFYPEKNLDNLGNAGAKDELEASFLSAKLKYLEDWPRQRQEIATHWYSEKLKGIGDLILPKTPIDLPHVYPIHIVRTELRDAFQKHLTERRIGILTHYPILPYLQKVSNFLGLKKDDFSIAEELTNTSLSLPIWSYMTIGQINIITENILSFFKK